jgi:hypothetical protein
MSRWFRFEEDEINNPAVLRLSDKAHRAWIGLLCVASKHDGILPPQEDCALTLRLPVERLAEAIVTLVGAGLLDRDEAGTLSPTKWSERQYKSDVSTEWVKRFRQRSRNADETAHTTTHNNTTQAETVAAGYYAKADSEQLAAWDCYNIAQTGRSLPRDRRGGWRVPSEWPPMHSVKGRA